MGSQTNQIATQLEAKTIGGGTSSASSTKCVTKAFAQSVGCLVGSTYSSNQLVRYIHLSKLDTKYKITCHAGANGSVTADKSEAKFGETVKASATPDSGYVTSTFSIKTDAGSDVFHDSGIFTMPADNVTVSATFSEYVPTRPNAYMRIYNNTPDYGRTQDRPNVAFPLEDATTVTQASHIAQENTIQYYLVASPNDYGQYETLENFFDNTQQYCMGVGFWGFSGKNTGSYTNVFSDVYEMWDNFAGSGSNKIEHIELCGGWFNVLDEENWGYSVGYVGANGENWYEVNSVAELVAVPVRTDNFDQPSFAVCTYFLDGCPWPFTDYGSLKQLATFRRDQPDFGYNTNDISNITFTNLQPSQPTGTDVLTNKHWSSTYAERIVEQIMPKIVSSNGQFEIVRHTNGLCIRTFGTYFCDPSTVPNEGLRFALFCYSDDVLQDVIWTENYVDTTLGTTDNENVMCFVKDTENGGTCDILFAYDTEIQNPDFVNSVVRTYNIGASNTDIINSIIDGAYNRITLYIQVYDMDGKDFPAYENQYLKTCFRVDQTYGASRWYTLWTHTHDHCMMWQYDD